MSVSCQSTSRELGNGSTGPWLTLVRDFIEPSAQASLYQQLLQDIDWRSEHIRLFGKSIQVPRLVAWYGDSGTDYRYAGTDHVPSPWLEPLAALRDHVSAACGLVFNSVLANRYRNGQDSMGWHSDNEAELGEDPVIASVSLGAPRQIRFRHRRRHQPPLGVTLPAGSLLIMRGATQTHWQHGVPKTRRPVGERINLTFRRICPAGEVPPKQGRGMAE